MAMAAIAIQAVMGTTTLGYITVRLVVTMDTFMPILGCHTIAIRTLITQLQAPHGTTTTSPHIHILTRQAIMQAGQAEPEVLAEPEGQAEPEELAVLAELVGLAVLGLLGLLGKGAEPAEEGQF
jgi:hypothetical protein